MASNLAGVGGAVQRSAVRLRVSNELPQAVALLRVSTNQQAESGLGLEAQRAAIVAFAAQAGIHVAHCVTEEGVSGGADLADRPGLLEALALVEAEQLSHLVVSCHDRLARSVLTAELVINQLARTGATLLSADGAGNDTSPEAELMRRIVGAMAAYERARIALRTRAALRAKRARGEHLGPATIGQAPGPIGEREAAALSRLAELRRADPKASHAKLAAALAAEGHATRRGRRVDKAWVLRALAATGR